jgi:hemolysin activation/secretion protein
MCKFPGVAICLSAVACGGAAAQPLPAEALRIEQQQLERQQQRDQALRERMAPAVHALPGVQRPGTLALPASESPCFALQAIRLTGPRSGEVPWLLPAAGLDLGARPCIGAQGIEVILARLQHALVARGLITSRVLVGAQNLHGGVLELTFQPGTVRQLRLGADGTATAAILGALPSRPGQLLQLRDIEQGLENLQRVPTAEADIEIAAAEGPGAAPGESDLLIRYHQASAWRLNLALDNGGTRATGRLQGTATLSWDNPLRRNDLLYLSLGRGLATGGRRGTRNATLHYSLPFGYWLAGMTAASNRYQQNVAGAYQDYVYSGEASQLDVQLSRVIHRSAWARTTAELRVFHRASSNAVDDTQIDVQRRRTSGYALGLAQRRYLGAALIEGSLTFKRGTGAFGALRAPEEPWGEGTSRMKIYTADLALTQPLELAGARARFSSAWHGQWNATPLTLQDRIGLGGRYTVRGFDGDSTLLAERGRYWRNELGVALNASVEAFVALDTGRVGGPAAQSLAGRSLSGTAIGLRGAGRGFSSELMLGTPLRKPANFRTARRHLSLGLFYRF